MADELTANQRESARRACEDAVIRFTAHFDAKEHSEMERYFANDGLWVRRGGDIRGIDGLREGMHNRPASALVRHVISNMRTQLISADQAVVDSYVTVYRHVFAPGEQAPAPMGLPFVMGRYKDEMVREGGTWKIAVRRSSEDFGGKKS